MCGLQTADGKKGKKCVSFRRRINQIGKQTSTQSIHEKFTDGRNGEVIASSIFIANEYLSLNKDALPNYTFVCFVYDVCKSTNVIKTAALRRPSGFIAIDIEHIFVTTFRSHFFCVPSRSYRVLGLRYADSLLLPEGGWLRVKNIKVFISFFVAPPCSNEAFLVHILK